MERLQKVIANSGYCSRRKAEELIAARKVTVNGEIVSELGVKVSGNDQILVNGSIIDKEDKEYILLNKPRGVVTTTSDDKNRKTVIDLVNSNKRLYPVGRLDYDTTGVLLLTNDGELTNILMHPSNKIDKVYTAKIEGILKKEEIEKLKKGLVIDGYKTARCYAKIKKIDKKTNKSLVQLTIHEGKNHQVKNMFKALGYEVLKLKRDQVAFLTTETLKPGESRKLTIKEVKKLYSLK